MEGDEDGLERPDDWFDGVRAASGQRKSLYNRPSDCLPEPDSTMDHLFKSSSKRLDAVKNQDWSREIGADADRLHLQVARELSLPGEVVSLPSHQVVSLSLRADRVVGGQTAMAFDPLQSLFAVGTAAGSLHVWGAPAVTLTWRNRPTHQIKHLAFKGSLLLCVGKSSSFVSSLGFADAYTNRARCRCKRHAGCV